MLRIDINDINIKILLLCEYFIPYFDIFYSVYFTLFMCILCSLLDRFCSLLSLFESTFILSTHTLQCKRWLISNQSIYASCCFIYAIHQTISIQICMYNQYIYIYVHCCTVVLRPRVIRPTEIACRTMGHAFRQGKYPSSICNDISCCLSIQCSSNCSYACVLSRSLSLV